MSTLPARNRVIYQSEALFVSPDTTGHHLYYIANSGFATGDINNCTEQIGAKFFDACKGLVADDSAFQTNVEDLNYRTFDCFTGKDAIHPVVTGALGDHSPIINNSTLLAHLQDNSIDTGSVGSTARQLKRVQNANYSFTINRQDVNQFGQLGRIDSVVLEAPTVSLDFSYYLTDGYNERQLGFVTDGKLQSLSGMMTRAQNDFGNNYFILTVPEGRDAIGGDVLVEESEKTVIGLGNGYITDYSLEASVGSFPTASVTVEGLNIRSDKGTHMKAIPAVQPTDGTEICDRCFSLPPAISGEGSSVLKPGDITIDLKNSSLISKQISGTAGGYGEEDKGSAHIQSFTLSTPLGRTDLQRLGNTYAYAKEVDFPVTCTLSVNALVADLKVGRLTDLLCGEKYDMSIKILQPKCVGCNPNDNEAGIKIDFKDALLDSESFSSSIGDNKSVDLTFTTQIGGPEQKNVGVFFSGVENWEGTDKKFKTFPDVAADAKGNLKYYEWGSKGTTDTTAPKGRY